MTLQVRDSAQVRCAIWRLRCSEVLRGLRGQWYCTCNWRGHE